MTIEQRIERIESNQIRVSEMIVGVLEGLQSLHGTMFALGLWMQTQTETLPGEELPAEPPKPN
jgi:hypothetical protein